MRVNLFGPTTTLKGYEFEASYDAGKAYIGGAYTRLAAIYDGIYDPFFAGPPNGDAYLPLLPIWQREFFFIFLPPKEKYTLDGGIRLFDRNVTLGARMTYVAPTVPLGQQLLPAYQLDSYHLYDLYSTFAFSKNLIARVNVDNLLDKAYVDAMGVPTLSGSRPYHNVLIARKFLTKSAVRLNWRIGCF